ncbi:hypothetical protein HDU91_006244 [Kappamyces sp. JEL0680]|nr:hypothetical protein HDU91_006244 [Kappamyces sp. JEL0680]
MKPYSVFLCALSVSGSLILSTSSTCSNAIDTLEELTCYEYGSLGHNEAYICDSGTAYYLQFASKSDCISASNPLAAVTVAGDNACHYAYQSTSGTSYYARVSCSGSTVSATTGTKTTTGTTTRTTTTTKTTTTDIAGNNLATSTGNSAATLLPSGSSCAFDSQCSSKKCSSSVCAASADSSSAGTPSNNVGLVVGLVVAGVVVLAALAAYVVYGRRKHPKDDDASTLSSYPPSMYAPSVQPGSPGPTPYSAYSAAAPAASAAYASSMPGPAPLPKAGLAPIVVALPSKIQTNESIRRLAPNEPAFAGLADIFMKYWLHEPGAPQILSISLVLNSEMVESRFSETYARLGHLGYETLFHGAKRTCSIGTMSNSVCQDPSCAVCGIISNGFDVAHYAPRFREGRFGRGIYFTSSSGKANDYTQQVEVGAPQVMFIGQVLLGNRREPLASEWSNSLPAPSSYDSVHAKAGVIPDLFYDEYVVYKGEQCIPRYIVEYRFPGHSAVPYNEQQ